MSLRRTRGFIPVACLEIIQQIHALYSKISPYIVEELVSASGQPGQVSAEGIAGYEGQ